MSLADALQHEREQGMRKGPDCRLCVALRAMDKADASALAEAMADPSITTAAIFRALKREGFDVSANITARHRRGECQRR